MDDDCQQLQCDLENVYQCADSVNMQFNSEKFEWVRYAPDNKVPTFQYSAPDTTDIEKRDSLRDLGVILSSDFVVAKP